MDIIYLTKKKGVAMRKVLVIGCPGAGKSVFARNLARITKLPLHHLDMINWNSDKTTLSKEEFISALEEILKTEEWIIDGNYGSTIPLRLAHADTVFSLDYPNELCLESVKNRVGEVRPDMPWVEQEIDDEFIQFIKDFPERNRPEILKLLENFEGEINIFKSREEASKYLDEIQIESFDSIRHRNWISVEHVDKGWSSDSKYKITRNNDVDLLMRVSSIDKYNQKIKEFEMMQKFSQTGVNMSQPVEFGVINEKEIYSLLTWMEGVDLEEVLPTLSKTTQYQLGLEAGRILRKFHSIPLDDLDIPSETKVAKKLIQIESYENSIHRVEDDEKIIDFVKNNLDKLWVHPPCYLHGDFHPGNLIINAGKIAIIDFNRWEIGDSYEEFYKMQFFARPISVEFCKGQLRGYFGESIPEEFWEAQKVYVAHSSLYSIKWAEKFGDSEIENMKSIHYMVKEDYDDFNRLIPKWFE